MMTDLLLCAILIVLVIQLWDDNRTMDRIRRKFRTRYRRLALWVKTKKE